MTRVVIVGGGFAGLYASKELANARDIDATLIDERNHQLFLYPYRQLGMCRNRVLSRALCAQLNQCDFAGTVESHGKSRHPETAIHVHR